MIRNSYVLCVRLKLTIAYDGRPYSGWGKQPHGNTVQDHLEKAVSEVAKKDIRVHGSGRTDAGVHAAGQVAHFDAPARSLSDLINPANSFYKLVQIAPTSLQVSQYIQVSQHDLTSISKLFCSNLVKSDRLLARISHTQIAKAGF